MKIKSLIVVMIILIVGCKKSSSTQSSTSDEMVSYGKAGYTSSWIQQYGSYMITSPPGSIINRILYSSVDSSYGGYSGKLYEFYFSLNLRTSIYELTFAIPGDSFPNFSIPVNKQLNYNFNSSYYKIASSAFTISFSSTQAIGSADSATLSLTITRLSNNTMDGNFSFQIFGSNGSASGYANNGVSKMFRIKMNKNNHHPTHNFNHLRLDTAS